MYYARKFKDLKKGVISKNKARTIFKTDNAVMMIQAGGIWKTLYLENRSVKIKKRRFIEPAGDVAGYKMPQTFIKEFNNYTKRIK